MIASGILSTVNNLALFLADFLMQCSSTSEVNSLCLEPAPSPYALLNWEMRRAVSWLRCWPKWRAECVASVSSQEVLVDCGVLCPCRWWTEVNERVVLSDSVLGGWRCSCYWSRTIREITGFSVPLAIHKWKLGALWFVIVEDIDSNFENISGDLKKQGQL